MDLENLVVGKIYGFETPHFFSSSVVWRCSLRSPPSTAVRDRHIGWYYGSQEFLLLSVRQVKSWWWLEIITCDESPVMGWIELNGKTIRDLKCSTMF